MTWTVGFTPRSKKDLQRLPVNDQRRITDFLLHRVCSHPEPRALAKRLERSSKGLWRFRVGDNRIIVRFRDDRLIIVVLRIGNRREIYR